MIDFFIRWVLNAVTLLVVVRIIPGITAAHWETVGVAALVLGLLNAFLKPLILLFTLPLNILSLGFLTFLVNGFLFYLVSKIVEGFYVVDFWTAFWGALLFSVISFVLNLFVGRPIDKINMRFYREHVPPDFADDNIIDVEGKSEDDDGEHKKITDDR